MPAINKHILFAGLTMLLACSKADLNGEAARNALPADGKPPIDQPSVNNVATNPAAVQALSLKGFALGMDIQDAPGAMMALLADQQLSGFGFTGVVRLSNGAQCVLMYGKSFMDALQARARDRFGAARAQSNVDEEILQSCENSDGIMTVHAGADGRVNKIQFNDVRHLFNTRDESAPGFAKQLAAEMHIPELTPDGENSTWNYAGRDGVIVSLGTRNALGIPMLRLTISRDVLQQP